MSVKRNGKLYRPTYNYIRNGWPGYGSAQLEMLESVRNVLEQVREEIRGLRSCRQVVRMFRDLSVISKNTTKRKYTRKVKAENR